MNGGGRFRRIAQGSAKDGFQSEDLPVGQYAKLLLIIRGTTDVGETLAPEDVGRIRIERKGEQISSETFSFWHTYTKLKGGLPQATLPTNGASRIVAEIPFWYVVPNVLDVRSKEEADVFLDFSDVLQTRFGANNATWELYGIFAPEVVQTYQLFVREQNFGASSSGVFDETLDAKNIAGIFFQDSADVVDNLTFEADGEVKLNNVDDDALTDLTNIINSVEASALDLSELNLIPAGNLGEAVNSANQLAINFNASGTLNITIFSIRFLDNAQSSERANSRQRSQIAKAQQLSKVGTIPAGAVSKGN